MDLRSTSVVEGKSHGSSIGICPPLDGEINIYLAEDVSESAHSLLFYLSNFMGLLYLVLIYII